MKRVRHVTSIEHDAGWMAHLRTRVDANVTIVPASVDTPETYTAFLDQNKDFFDLILVDGRHRVECFRKSLGHLSDAGVMMLDDSDRQRYQPMFGIARDAGFRALQLMGHKPGSLRLHRTSFFYRDGNCLGF
jgi:hypothetical protein